VAFDAVYSVGDGLLTFAALVAFGRTVGRAVEVQVEPIKSHAESAWN
jgi:hypothetical protein